MNTLIWDMASGFDTSLLIIVVLIKLEYVLSGNVQKKPKDNSNIHRVHIPARRRKFL